MAFDPDAFLAKTEVKKGFDPDAFLAQSVVTVDTPADEKSWLMDKLGKTLGVAGAALDYAGGLSRTTIGQLADGVTEGDIIQDGDWMKALKGQAPSSAVMLERAGVPEGVTMSDMLPGMYSETGEGLALQKGGWADPSARGAAGFALDVASDPLTYATFGVSGAAKAGKLGKAGAAAEKALKPASNIMEKLGEKIYKSGLKRIDQEAMKYGKDPVSDVLMKYNVAGSAQSIQKQMDGLAGQLVERQKAILAEADQAGAVVDMQKAMAETQQLISDIRASKDPRTQAAADELEKQIAAYTDLNGKPARTTTKQAPTGEFDPYTMKPKMAEVTEELPAVPGVTPSQASGFKTSIYDSLPKGAFAETIATASGKSPKLLAGEKLQARGLKEGVEDAVSQIGRGEELKLLNDELGRILTTRDKQMAEGFKEANKNVFTSVDGMLVGAKEPWVLAAKKAADIAKATGPRTRTGRMLRNQGKGELSGPIWDILLRQSLIDREQDEQP